ncbi:RES family NAD+ phosphorylase [uncultured Hymenobacter sp.]|uniref:RES family NAD+ phosphorylase n=1 Tax=uncultured Hymenobacter sp. TaxID=170016 RepID=UPI0035CA7CC1
MAALLVYRVQKLKHLDTALTGGGARRTGGRWSPVDVPLVYASTSPELAFLENMVHLDGTPLADLPPFGLLTLELPADAVAEIPLADLPPGWDQRLYPDAVPQFLLPRLRPTDPALAFTMPSVVLPGSPTRNVLINPLHPRIAEVHILSTQPLVFDERLRSAALPVASPPKRRSRKL